MRSIVLSVLALLATTLIAPVDGARAAETARKSVSTKSKSATGEASEKAAPVPEPIPEPEPMQGHEAGPVEDFPEMFTGGEEEPDYYRCLDGNGAFCCMLNSFMHDYRGSFYGGAEYLLARPRFSNPFFAVEQSTITDQTRTPELTTQTANVVDFNFNYNSNLRAFLGYRLADCGGDVQFTYWHLTGSSSAVAGPADNEGGTLVIAGQLDLVPADGEFLTGSMSVTKNIYDIDFSKCLPLGGGDSCDNSGCPRWDLRWQAGLRIGDVQYETSNFVGPLGGPGTTFGDYKARFTGAGPKVGMQGRRYAGCWDRLSFYGKANASLLIGNVHINQITNTPGTEFSATVITEGSESHARMIPVTDLEVGATYEFCCCKYLTVGYFMQAWWDTGMAVSPCTTSFCPVDNSSISAFDGLFVRAEMVF